MVWFRVDDRFPDHPKLTKLESEPDRWARAVALWVAAGAWSAGNMTDGFVTRDRARRVTPFVTRDADRAIADLVKTGLWEEVKDGFKFHDWEDYQPTKAEEEHKRKYALERQRRRRERLNNESVTPCVTRDKPVPDPTRPDPTRMNEGEGIARGEFSDDCDLGRNEVEQIGFLRFGALVGEKGIAVVRLCPVKGWEMKDALAANIHAWGGFVTVINRIRLESAKPPPLPSGPRQLTGDDALKARAIAKINAYEEQRAREEQEKANAGGR